MSWFIQGLQAVTTVTTDVIAKTTKLAINGAAEVVGNFDGNAKKNMQYVALEAEKQIRRNVITDAINDINSNERQLTKDFIRYIDMIHDIETSQSKEDFISNLEKENLWMWSVYAYIPYVFHEYIKNGRMSELNFDNVESMMNIFKIEADKSNIDFSLIEQQLKEFFTNYTLKYIDKDCYMVQNNDLCIIGFCGTDTDDIEHIKADISVGNLVGGYHYKMADLACQYYEILKQYIDNKELRIKVVGHSLGAGIAEYFNLLYYYLEKDSLNKTDIKSYGFGVPCVLPRVFKNRISERMINVIDEKDFITKLYKNENIAHVNQLVHIDGDDKDYKYIGMFMINWNRFNPLLQVEKLNYDMANTFHHSMKNYMSICKYQTENKSLITESKKVYKF